MLTKQSIVALSVLVIMGCAKIMPQAPEDDAVLDGPIPGLNEAETQQFILGDVAFNDDIFTAQNGLGPFFISNSCGSCHAGDGKGHPFTTLTRFGQTDSTGNKWLAHGAPQLQHRALPGYNPEKLPDGVSYAKLLPPANTGLGFLDAVTDADLIAMADETDADADGISGVPNWINLPTYAVLRDNAVSLGNKYIGRFGKKGAAYDLLQQTANAYNQDMGIVSTFEPVDTYTKMPVDPEVSDATIQNVVFYLKTLKAPIQRNKELADVTTGKNIFVATGCEKCHKATLKTGPSNIAALSNKTFYPYTDLLLHDMGTSLDDNYTEGSAHTYEWRTPALWGLGLSKNSQGGNYFLMHDGRAKSIEDAILMHGGEAQPSSNNFKQLSTTEKKQLITFLESL
jgi:CxxC motif-containing protein (DUF1111 family)